MGEGGQKDWVAQLSGRISSGIKLSVRNEHQFFVDSQLFFSLASCFELSQFLNALRERKSFRDIYKYYMCIYIQCILHIYVLLHIVIKIYIYICIA